MSKALGPVETSLAIYRGFEWLQTNRNVSIDVGSRYNLRADLPNRMTSIH
ncbi:MAG: hypothetical protein U1E36_09185 [Rickettsiales bacterium]